MRLHRLLATVLAITLTALLVPASAPAADADGVLSMAAARSATRSVAWEVARRNPLVRSVKVGACRRLASDKVFCEAIDRGSSSTLKTTCKVRVRVTLEGTRPKGTLRGVHCENERLAVLRAPQALEATQPVAEDLAGRNVGVNWVGRVSRTEIKTMAGWTRPSAANPAVDEVCALYFRVTLMESGEVTVRLTESFCVVPNT